MGCRAGGIRTGWMQERTDAGKEGCLKGFRKKGFRKKGVKTGWIQERRVQERRDTELERCYSRQEDKGQLGGRTGGMQDWRESELEGFKTGGIQDWRAGGIQDWRDAGKGDSGKEEVRK